MSATTTQGIDREGMIPFDFVSMGMIIIDDIYQADDLPTLDQLGGAGTYATMGARLFYPRTGTNPRREPVGFIIHAGSDFPQSVRNELRTCLTDSPILETPNRATTRGKNTYANEVREFTFLNPKIQVDASMLNPAMLTSKTYHLICSPSRCMDLTLEIRAKRQVAMRECPHLRDTFIEPIFVWEPIEGSCKPSELNLFYEALKGVQVFSPNEHELGLLFKEPNNEANEAMSIELINRRCKQLLASGFGDKPSVVVIRRGADGCVIATHDRFTSFPAYYTPPTNGTPEEISAWHAKRTSKWDVTGGGNAFLGGFCVGLLDRPNDHIDDFGFTEFETAAIYGSVAASFAIEQVGMPKVSHGENRDELWNGDAVNDRMAKMRNLCAGLLPPDLPEEELRKASLFEVSMISADQKVRFFTRKGNNDYLRQGSLHPKPKNCFIPKKWIC